MKLYLLGTFASAEKKNGLGIFDVSEGKMENSRNSIRGLSCLDMLGIIYLSRGLPDAVKCAAMGNRRMLRCRLDVGNSNFSVTSRASSC